MVGDQTCHDTQVVVVVVVVREDVTCCVIPMGEDLPFFALKFQDVRGCLYKKKKNNLKFHRGLDRQQLL